jgi:hypothetical protein
LEQAPLPTVPEPEAPLDGFGKNSARARLIRKILVHPGLWLANARPIPRAHSPRVLDGPPDPSFSQIPPSYENEFNQPPPPAWDF